jgi:hypothetical protein
LPLLTVTESDDLAAIGVAPPISEVSTQPPLILLRLDDAEKIRSGKARVFS